MIGSQGGQIVEFLDPAHDFAGLGAQGGALGRADFGLALAANESSLFVVGGRDLGTNQLPGDVWRFQASSQTWTHLPILGTQPKIVLATTYRAQEAALYVVDEIDPGPGGPRARLLRIDLSTRESTLLGNWPRKKKLDRVYLSNTEGGALLLVGSSSTQGKFTGVAFDPAGDLEKPYPLSFHGNGTVVVEPTLTNKGLTVPINENSLTNLFTPIEELLSNPGNKKISGCL